MLSTVIRVKKVQHNTSAVHLSEPVGLLIRFWSSYTDEATVEELSSTRTGWSLLPTASAATPPKTSPW